MFEVKLSLLDYCLFEQGIMMSRLILLYFFFCCQIKHFRLFFLKEWTGTPAFAHLYHWLFIIMDDVSPLPTTMQKWSQNSSFTGAAILLVWCHLEPELGCRILLRLNMSTKSLYFHINTILPQPHLCFQHCWIALLLHYV